jgi:flagellar motor switch/type III secretory pathway protein FliN
MSSAATEREVEKVKVSLELPAGDDARWLPVLGLPCAIAVELPIPGFKVRDFQSLRPGSVITTGSRVSHDVPVRVNGALIAWGEFDGSGKRLAVRLTELA